MGITLSIQQMTELGLRNGKQLAQGQGQQSGKRSNTGKWMAVTLGVEVVLRHTGQDWSEATLGTSRICGSIRGRDGARIQELWELERIFSVIGIPNPRESGVPLPLRGKYTQTGKILGSLWTGD